MHRAASLAVCYDLWRGEHNARVRWHLQFGNLIQRIAALVNMLFAILTVYWTAGIRQNILTTFSLARSKFPHLLLNKTAVFVFLPLRI